MSEIEDLIDVGIGLDIVSLMAIFTFAREFKKEETDLIFEGIERDLSEKEDYEDLKEKLSKLIKAYQNSVENIQNFYAVDENSLTNKTK